MTDAEITQLIREYGTNFESIEAKVTQENEFFFGIVTFFVAAISCGLGYFAGKNS